MWRYHASRCRLVPGVLRGLLQCLCRCPQSLTVRPEASRTIALRLEQDPWTPMGLLRTVSIDPWTVLLGGFGAAAP